MAVKDIASLYYLRKMENGRWGELIHSKLVTAVLYGRKQQYGKLEMQEKEYLTIFNLTKFPDNSAKVNFRCRTKRSSIY
ncbi:MAG: hypothetical protein ABIK61_03810 [candidate division WOR-3 bacterium]